MWQGNIYTYFDQCFPQATHTYLPSNDLHIIKLKITKQTNNFKMTSHGQFNDQKQNTTKLVHIAQPCLKVIKGFQNHINVIIGLL